MDTYPGSYQSNGRLRLTGYSCECRTSEGCFNSIVKIIFNTWQEQLVIICCRLEESWFQTEIDITRTFSGGLLVRSYEAELKRNMKKWNGEQLREVIDKVKLVLSDRITVLYTCTCTYKL